MSEKTISRMRHGQARIEFRACKKEVEEKIAAAGKLSISYSAFCDYVRGEGQRIHSRRKSALERLRKNGNNLSKPAAKPGPFYIDRSKTAEELC